MHRSPAPPRRGNPQRAEEEPPQGRPEPEDDTVAYHKTEAVVLRRSHYSETSLILTLFTREAGLLRGIAKGARRPKSLFDAGLEPFTRCSIVHLDRRSRGLAVLTEAAVLETFPGLRERLPRLQAAWLAAELLPALTAEGEALPATYDLLVAYLRTVAGAEAVDPLVLAFTLQVLAQAGYRPQLDRCVGCGAALGARRLRLSARLGGFVCPGCEGEGGRLVVVGAGSAAALRNFLLAPLKAVEKVHLSLRMKKECYAAVGALLVEVVGRPLRTWSLVQRRG